MIFRTPPNPSQNTGTETVTDMDDKDEPVAWAGEMPGSNGGFTMAAFKASDVPVGSPLFTRPISGFQVDLTVSPQIEALTPTSLEWDACETVQDRYDLMKRCVRRAVCLISSQHRD